MLRQVEDLGEVLLQEEAHLSLPIMKSLRVLDGSAQLYFGDFSLRVGHELDDAEGLMLQFVVLEGL